MNLDQGDFDVDTFLAESNEPKGDQITEGPVGESTAPAEQAAPSWDPTPWEFEWNGKKVAPDSFEKAKQWASLGHNYSQRVGEWNSKERDYQKKLSDYETKVKAWNHYNDVDQYAQSNPEWWNHVQEQWKNRSAQQQAVDPNFQSALNPVLEKVGQFESFMTQIQQERQNEQLQKEDQQLSTEVDSIRKSHPNIDLSAVDDSGKPLELRILEHAQEIGTKSFRVAFRDYLHEQLVGEAKAQGLSSSQKQAEQLQAKGILGKSPTPKKGIEPAGNVKSKSYNDLTKEALAELGL